MKHFHETQIVQLHKLGLHEECKNQCRSSIILQYIDRYPECLTNVDGDGCMPLHRLLLNQAASIDVTLRLIEKYPAALLHKSYYVVHLPLLIECKNQCRSSIISKCIELYPETAFSPLSQTTQDGYLPLHLLLENKSSTVEDALMMINTYPEALQRKTLWKNDLLLHIECKNQCRSIIIWKCIDCYPPSVTTTGNRNNLPL
jgi:hypothetical protein